MSTYDMMPKEMPRSSEEFDEWVIERATIFHTVRDLGRGNQTKISYPTLLEAIDGASATPRTRVYAGTASGRGTMVAPRQYARALEIVGRKA